MNSTATKSTPATRKPTAQWVPVRDSQGREHLEMRWSIAGVQRVPLTRVA